MEIRKYKSEDCAAMADFQKEAGDTAKNCFITHASITARPFFEKRGYRVIREQLVERRGEKLKNFVMEKAFFAGGKEAEQKGSL